MSALGVDCDTKTLNIDNCAAIIAAGSQAVMAFMSETAPRGGPARAPWRSKKPLGAGSSWAAVSLVRLRTVVARICRLRANKP